MGHRLVEDAMDRQENEQNDRMDIIAQNGNDGEHYEDSELENADDVAIEFDYSDNDIPTFDLTAGGLAYNQKNYILDVAMIHDLEDVKDILECMNLNMNVFENPSEVQKRLIDSGIFKKI
tara:strand:+ start:349 stop:708 length:360 start_codon:yes stop_codon:yes gene_type:complete